jgi:hypothetical protein
MTSTVAVIAATVDEEIVGGAISVLVSSGRGYKKRLVKLINSLPDNVIRYKIIKTVTMPMADNSMAVYISCGMAYFV